LLFCGRKNAPNPAKSYSIGWKYLNLYPHKLRSYQYGNFAKSLLVVQELFGGSPMEDRAADTRMGHLPRAIHQVS